MRGEEFSSCTPGRPEMIEEKVDGLEIEAPKIGSNPKVRSMEFGLNSSSVLLTPRFSKWQPHPDLVLGSQKISKIQKLSGPGRAIAFLLQSGNAPSWAKSLVSHPHIGGIVEARRRVGEAPDLSQETSKTLLATETVLPKSSPSQQPWKLTGGCWKTLFLSVHFHDRWKEGKDPRTQEAGQTND